MTTNSLPPQLFGYQVITELYHDAQIVVYQALQTDPQSGDVIRPVVIKLLSSPYPTYQEFLNFRHQYTITKDLNIPGVLRTYGLEENYQTPHHRSYALVMEDFEGISLAQYRKTEPCTLADILKIGSQLAITLQALGQQRIIHKDIKPANILINPVSKEIKLIDFSIASLLPRETTTILSPNLLEGTLAYLSPEQTGRMNRGIDYRADFYALGVTLYELLTGQLPFTTTDPLDLIHCHLARVAAPVHQIAPQVPVVVSQIVAKLMSKNAEDRYQSAQGLHNDLADCLQQWETTGTISPFLIGQSDLSDRFIIPEKLYGRELAVKTLLEAFDRVAAGDCSLMLVAGSSGIGKTAVINEVHQPITRQQGYFIQGKFDQFQRHVPLSAFVQALRDLIGQLLSESDRQLAAWRQNIQSVVGENGQVLIEVIPELEQVIGSQPAVANLTGQAAQNRFNWLFQKLIAVLAQPTHPLVIFLDDLQWADPASLQLIKLLMENNNYLLLLGTYRDNEVSSIHPTMVMVEQLQQALKIVEIITLGPLSGDAINQLIADTFNCSIELTRPLTELITLKTQGNPFFTTQFLTALQRDGHINFNPQGYWECDITPVQVLASTTDMVEFMATQLQKLPPATQAILKLAAAIGSQFDLETLAIVAESSPLNIATDLWPALQAGLIIPSSQIYKFWLTASTASPDSRQKIEQQAEQKIELSYSFLHDQVQQAAYSLIPSHQQQQTSLKIGRLLLAHTPDIQTSDRLLQIVNQLNAGAGLIDDPIERDQLMQMNLWAARQAKSNAAYKVALTCSSQGIELLPARPWETQYQSTLALYEIAAETAQLSNDPRANSYINLVIEQARTPVDRCGIYQIQIMAAIAQGRLEEAVDIGISALAELDIPLNKQITQPLALVELFKTEAILVSGKLGLHQQTSILSDPRLLASMSFLNTLISISYLIYPNLFVAVSAQMVRISHRHGYCDYASIGYATYGIILVGALQRVTAGLKYTKQAWEISAQIANDSLKASLIFICVTGTRTWDTSLRDLIVLQQQGYAAGISSGNFEYAAWNLMNESAFLYNAGENLHAIEQQLSSSRQIITELNQEIPLAFNQRISQSIQNLLGNTADPLNFNSENFDEQLYLHQCQQSKYLIGILLLDVEKLMLHYLFNDLENAQLLIDRGAVNLDRAIGQFINCQFHFYSALTLLALSSHSEIAAAKQIDQKIAHHQKQIKTWAEYAPMNASHRWDLIEAERWRQAGEFTLAMNMYDQAIAGAQTNRFLQDEALANELAAKFYLAWGKEKIAAAYCQEAYYCYTKWGAKAKTDHLAKTYRQLLRPVLQQMPPADQILNALVTIAHSSSHHLSGSQTGATLDLGSVIQSAQVLSSTIELEVLIQKLSRIILQNAGAETCLLALPNPQGEWQIRSIVTVHDQAAATNCVQRLSQSGDYPANLIHWIKNTQTTLLADARYPLAVSDRYLRIHQPPSVLALPIVKQSQVLGVLYLEHRQMPGVFTENTKTVISFLCDQAALALDNANLYQKSQAATAQALRQQSYLEALLDNIPHMAWIKDQGGQFITVNQPFAEIANMQPSDLINKSDQELWPVELAQKYRDDDLQVMANGQRQQFTEQITSPTGEERWLETIRTPIRNSTGVVTGIVGIALDITDRRRGERQRQFTQFAVDNSADGIAWLRPDGSFAYGNKAICRMLGYSFGEFCTLHVWDIDDINLVSPTAWTKHWQLLKINQELTLESEHQCKDGCRYPVELSLNYFEFEGEEYNFVQVRNISNRKRMEIALRNSEARYRQIVSNIPAALYQVEILADGNYQINYTSAKFLELSELPATTALTDIATVFDLIIPADREDFERSFNHTAQSWAWEGRILTPTGRLKWIRGEASPTTTPEGRLLWDGILLDITDRKQAEIALRQSEERYHQLISNIPGALYQFEVDADETASRMVYVSSRFYELFEIDPTTELSQLANWDNVYPADREGFIRSIQTATTAREPWQWEGRITMPNGQIKWIRGESSPVAINNGQLLWDGILMDITDRKRAELELLSSKQFLQTILDSFPLYVFWKDRDLVYLGGNNNFAHYSGLESLTELVGKTDYDIYSATEATAYRSADQVVIDRETPQLGIIEVQSHPDGSQTWLEINKVPLRNAEGQVIGVVGTFQDISDRQQAQLDLRLTNERLEMTIKELQRVTRLKDEFLATMSHELRTPLNAVLGMSEALQEQVFGDLNPRQIKSLQTIDRSGKHLLSLITDILDVSKISAGKLELEIKAVPIAILCQSSMTFIQQQAYNKQLQINLQLPPVAGQIAVDERRLRQVLINLLGNAVKFTPAGGKVSLVVTRPPSDDGTNWIEFKIIDTGIGIAPADLHKLFQPFVQIDSSLNRQYEGTGLGLTLVKQIVELHGGQVQLQSEVGRGSCFTVRLPDIDWRAEASVLIDPLGSLVPIDNPTPGHQLTQILIAEDNEANINTLSSYLKAKGYQLNLARNGQEAIELVQQERPDLILMDIQMPGMDGLEAITVIRQQLRLTDIPIIALTALAMEGDRERCLAAGANEYLTKPVKLKQLSQTIQNFLNQQNIVIH